MSSHQHKSQPHEPSGPSVAESLGCPPGDAEGVQWIQLVAEAGYLHLYAGRCEDAAAAFEAVTVLAPAAACGHIGLAEVRLRERRFRDAERLARHASLLPRAGRDEVAFCHRLVANALRGVRRVADAEAALERATALDPNGAQGAAATMTLAWWRLGAGRERAGVAAPAGKVQR